ncbi:MAG: hypothetical protein IT457_11635 [Planctomycetes bacterium]|nr:hypothetical protein [Planctomycetota bacterium]
MASGPGPSRGASSGDEELEFTVASVWREERVSCPHVDLLKAWLGGSLTGGAAEFVAFHVEESRCPWCAASIDALRAQDEDASRRRLEDVRDRLLRSTISALRATRA